MLTIVGYVSQNNIIYKCTKLHNHSLNRKWDIFQTANTILLDVKGGDVPPPPNIEKNIFFCTDEYIYIT